MNLIQNGLGAKENLSNSEELTNYILTVLALQILAVHFVEKKAEWKMIMTKANKWQRTFKAKNSDRKDAINQVEKDVKNMVESFQWLH